MALVEAVLREQPPVAVAVLDATADACTAARPRAPRAVAPSADAAVRSPMNTQTRPSNSAVGYVGTRTLPQIGESGPSVMTATSSPSLRPVGPAVVGAGQRAGELLLPQRERHAPVRASVVERVHAAALVAHEHEVGGARHATATGSTPTSRRPLHRVPVVAEPVGGGLVRGPRRPVLASRGRPRASAARAARAWSFSGRTATGCVPPSTAAVSLMGDPAS